MAPLPFQADRGCKKSVYDYSIFSRICHPLFSYYCRIPFCEHRGDSYILLNEGASRRGICIAAGMGGGGQDIAAECREFSPIPVPEAAARRSEPYARLFRWQSVSESYLYEHKKSPSNDQVNWGGRERSPPLPSTPIIKQSGEKVKAASRWKMRARGPPNGGRQALIYPPPISSGGFA